MPQFECAKQLDYKIEELYSLIIDIDSYPEFIPWCSHAKIIEKTEEKIIADVTISFKIFSETYRSEVLLMPPKNDDANVEAKLISGPLSQLSNLWKLKRLEKNKTLLNFYVDFKFNSVLLNMLAEKFFSIASDKVMESFEKRAEKLFGNQTD